MIRIFKWYDKIKARIINSGLLLKIRFLYQIFHAI